MAGDLDIVGGAAVDVVPIVPNFHRKLKDAILPIADAVGLQAGQKMGEKMGDAMKAALTGDAQRIGNDLGDAIGDAMARRIVAAIPTAVNQGGKAGTRAAGRQGDNAGGAFANSMRRKLEAAFKAMPKLDVRLGDTGVDAELARIRSKLETLSNKRIGIDVSAEAAEAEVARLEEQLRRLGAAHPNIAVRADTAAARAALAEMREEIAILTADPARIRVETDGALGTKLRAAVKSAEASLPAINIDANSSAADVAIARVRAELTSLSDQRVGIDIDAGQAVARVTALRAELQRLAASSPDVAVRVDAAAAEVQLAAVHAQINSVDRDDVNIRVRASTAQAQAALFQLAIAVGVVAALPVIPVAAAGIGAITSAAVTAGAGIGALALVAIPAIKGVTSVIQTKSAAEKEAASATDNSAAASVKASQQALQMVSAQAALSSAHRNAARSIAQANRQIEDAERAVAQAAQRAADQRRQAAQNVERAERSLLDAKRDAKQAEEDLTQARREAAQQLADLNDRLADGQLDSRDAVLRVREAQEELNRVLADPKATDLQRERAQLAYDQAVRNADEQAQSYKDLEKEAAKARAAGVSGNADVKRAADRLSESQRNVADQSAALADAQRQSARAQVEAAQTVADAQRKLSDAVRNAADVQVQATDSIAAAERGVESARLSGIDTTAQAATKADAYREALAKLSPEQRDLYDSIAGPNGLTKAYKAWVKELQPDVLPIFTRGVDGAKKSLPGLSPLVRNSAKAVSELQASASRDLKRPFWQRFKKDIATGARPAIVGLGKAFGNTLKGMAGVVDAFLPHMDSIADRMVKSTRRFANWGTGLKGSSEFEKFLDYADTTGKILGETFGDLMDAFFEVSRALRPISEVVLKFLGGLAEGIAIVADKAPWMVQGIWLAIVAMKVWTVVQWALNAAMSANPIGLIILAFVALVAAGIYAFNKFPWFRDLVLKAWDGIKTASMWLWEKALKPFFEWFGVIVVWLWEKIIKPYVKFMIAYWTMVGTVISWLWRKVFRPYFGFIGDLIAWWWRNIVKRYFGFVVDGIKVVGAAFAWLYRKGVKPQVEAISAIVSYIYNKGLKPAFNRMKTAVGLVADAFKSAKDAIGKNWSKVSEIAKRPVNFVIEWVYTKGIKRLFDGVSKYVGMEPLPKAPKLLEAGGTVGNGWSIAKPMKTNRPTAIVGEGNPRYPEYVIPTDPKYRARAMSLHQAAGTQLLARGGVVGDIGDVWDWTKDTASDVVGKGIDWAKTGADILTNPSKIWDKLMKPILGRVKEGVSVAGKWGAVIGKLPFKMADGLRDKIVNAVSFSGGGGGGAWLKPVAAAYGTPFGKAGSMWSSGRHTGLDFPAATGTAVKAVADGRVSTATSGGPYGNHILIDHGAGLQSLYAHLSRMRVTSPKVVDGGDRIGDVGATGNTTGPHLHLEARLNGKPVDPMKYLNGGGGGFNANAVGAAQQYAKSILSRYGWGASQFGPLKKLWDGESNWRWNAKNPSSGAYGIPQSLPASKMASAGSDWRTNYQTQIRWGLGYIKGRPDYGSPAAAYSKWLARSPHWYDDGGYLPPGLSLVANGTGKPEPVFTSGQWDTLRASAGGGPTELHADVHVFVGDREITDIVRTEIQVYDANVAASLTAGRYV